MNRGQNNILDPALNTCYFCCEWKGEASLYVCETCIYRARRGCRITTSFFMQAVHGAAHAQPPEPEGTAVLEGEHAEAHLTERVFV